VETTNRPPGAGQCDTLVVRLFGSFQVCVGARSIHEPVWGRRDACRLVKLLAASPQHRLHREQVIDRLWPDRPARSALTAFRSALHYARRTLEPDLARHSRSAYLDLTADGWLSLCPAAPLWVDADAFEAAANAALQQPSLATCRAALDLYKFTPAELLVIYDDVALPMGTLRLRPSGSAGGHNGLRSLESHLGTRDYPRLRIGIDPKPERMDLADYVLGKFSPDQQTKLPAVLDGCIEAIELIRREGFDKAMSLVNAKNFG